MAEASSIDLLPGRVGNGGVLLIGRTPDAIAKIIRARYRAHKWK